MSQLRILVDDDTLLAEWVEANPETRRAIAARLPLTGEATPWGAELYFPIDLEVTPSSLSREVPVGSVAYWPDGPAICLFWGPTPASSGDMPVAASPVAEIARIRDVSPLRGREGGATVRLEDAAEH